MAPAPKDPAQELAADLLDWESQFGAPDPKTDAECTIAPEDMVRWLELARKIAAAGVLK